MLRVEKWIPWADSESFPDCARTQKYLEVLHEEIRENGYRFGGYDHQSNMIGGVPIFSDGTAFRASLRGWGDVMSDVWDQDNNPLAYCDWAWTTYQKIENGKIPENVPVSSE